MLLAGSSWHLHLGLGKTVHIFCSTEIHLSKKMTNLNDFKKTMERNDAVEQLK